MPGSYRYGGLIATKDDGAEDRAVGNRIFSNFVLA